MEILTTDRLSLREFDTDDADFIIQLLNSPGWLQFIGDRNIKTTESAINYINNVFIKNYEKNGFGFWKVELLENKQPIGMCGITKRDGLDGVDIGFAFLPAFMGKGFAHEIASATLHHALTQIKLPFVLAITDTDNFRSIYLLEKIGFVFKQIIMVPNIEKEVNLYRIDNK